MTAITGMEVPPEVATAVLKRDGHACFRCVAPVTGRERGFWLRLPVADGGTLTAENLLMLCRSCLDRTGPAEARDRGWELASGQDPLMVPVQAGGALYAGTAREWLTADGRYAFTAPEGASAA